MVVVIGPLSQVPRRSDADFGGSYLGQDVILISNIVSHCVASSLKTLFSSAVVNSVCELKTL